MENAFLSRRYILVVVLVFFIMALATWAIAQETYMTTTPTAANQTQSQIDNLRQTVTPLSIFINNFLVSILAIVPLGGLIFFGRVMINTGVTIGQLAYNNHISPIVYVINIYIPVGTIENLAYAVVLAEGIFLLYALAKGNIVERLRTQTWKSLVLYLVLLTVAAIVEWALITANI